jgi:putative SOS response-associated peptidase YedK
LCGRYASTLPPDVLRELFQVVGSPANFPARYNAAPTDRLPVVRRNPETGERSLDLLRWGLVPRWAKDLSGGAKCINARGETVATLRSFADSFARRRCLVPATAFYEWQKASAAEGGASNAGATKIPWAVGMADGSPMVFAGIWEGWKDPADGTITRTFSIITTAANDVLRPVHERMPVILAPDRWAAWLGDDPATPEQLQSFLVPAANDAVRRWRVGPRVGSVRNDDAGLLEPVEA